MLVVYSPVDTEKSAGRILNFWILQALLTTTLPLALAAANAPLMYSIQIGSSMASAVVFELGLTLSAAPANLPFPGSAMFAPSWTKVTKAVLYFFWSPTIRMFEMPG